MSNDQQPNEQKGPTIMHALGIGGLIGGLIGVFFSCAFFIGANFFYGKAFVVPAVLVMLGALVGVSIPSTIKYKWFGLFVGAILGAVASYYLLDIF